MRHIPTYRQDPRWIVTRYPATCARCAAVIERGAHAFYYPNGKHIFCQDCGESAYAAFVAAAEDEAYNLCL